MQAEVNVEGGAKIFLQNKLQRSRAKLLELKPLLDEKSKFKDFDYGVSSWVRTFPSYVHKGRSRNKECHLWMQEVGIPHQEALTPSMYVTVPLLTLREFP